MPKIATWGPVLLEAADSFYRHQIDPECQSEVETYWDIVFAAAHQYSTPDFFERSDPRLDPIAVKLESQLDQGWLAGLRLSSPQSVYTFSSELEQISISNPDSERLGDEPLGVFWTSSFLSDGDSAWARTEQSEFATQKRPRKSFYFELGRNEEVFHIRTLADYRYLLGEYPRRTRSGHTGVDWIRAGKDLMAVHLTAAGLARVQCYRFNVDGAPACLTGWDAESTAWLRWPSSARVAVEQK